MRASSSERTAETARNQVIETTPEHCVYTSYDKRHAQVRCRDVCETFEPRVLINNFSILLRRKCLHTLEGCLDGRDSSRCDVSLAGALGFAAMLGIETNHLKCRDAVPPGEKVALCHDYSLLTLRKGISTVGSALVVMCDKLEPLFLPAYWGSKATSNTQRRKDAESQDDKDSSSCASSGAFQDLSSIRSVTPGAAGRFWLWLSDPSSSTLLRLNAWPFPRTRRHLYLLIHGQYAKIYKRSLASCRCRWLLASV